MGTAKSLIGCWPSQDTDPDPVKVRYYQELKFKVSYLKSQNMERVQRERLTFDWELLYHTLFLCSVPDDLIFLLLFNENVKNDKQSGSQL